MSLVPVYSFKLNHHYTLSSQAPVTQGTSLSKKQSKVNIDMKKNRSYVEFDRHNFIMTKLFLSLKRRKLYCLFYQLFVSLII